MLTVSDGLEECSEVVSVRIDTLPQKAYVSNYYWNVSVIDTATNTVVATVTVGDGPIGVTVTPDGAHTYVTNGTSNSVSVIETATNTVVTMISVGTYPRAVAIVPAACPDSDGYGVPDELDICPGFDDNADADGDTVPGGCDNCPAVENLGQEDFDEDGFGNACDPDDDNDGLADTDEVTGGTNPCNNDSDDDGVSDKRTHCQPSPA